MKLSDQAMGAIMMALQKSLAELTDIVPVLKSLDFKLEDGSSLVVTNPPTFKIDPESLPENISGTTGSD